MEKGSGTAKVYTLFPGCEMTILNIDGEKYYPDVNKNNNALEINYCLKGRAEFKMSDGCLQYIGQGDIFISTLKNHSDTMEYPLKNFEGFILYLDLDYINNDYINFFENDVINIKDLTNKFFKNDLCFLLQSRESTVNFFSEYKKIKEDRIKTYLKLKAYELLLLLESLNISKIKQPKVYNNTQVSIIKSILNYLKENIDKRYTIKELASKFHISETAIKTLFVEIYGTPISVYLKDYRIRLSKRLLIETNLNINEIAKEVGYSSLSKFGEVFKKEIGMSPSDFRKRH